MSNDPGTFRLLSDGVATFGLSSASSEPPTLESMLDAAAKMPKLEQKKILTPNVQRLIEKLNAVKSEDPREVAFTEFGGIPVHKSPILPDEVLFAIVGPRNATITYTDGRVVAIDFAEESRRWVDFVPDDQEETIDLNRFIRRSPTIQEMRRDYH